jgi:hypothetical protein
VGPARQREKKKKKETTARAVAGEGDSRLLGLLGRKVSEVSFLFFQTFFNSNVIKSNSNQKPSNFSQNFYNLFRSHTSNQKPCKDK